MGLSASVDILTSEEWSRSASVVVVVWVDQHRWVAGLWVGLWVDRFVRGGGSGGFCDGGCGCCLVGLVGVGLVDFFFFFVVSCGGGGGVGCGCVCGCGYGSNGYA